MSAIRRISVISVPVSDPDAAKEFYDRTLGFDLLADEEFAPGRRWIQLAPEGHEKTSVTLTTWLDDHPPGSLRGLILEVRDLDEAKVELQHRGLQFEGNDDDTPWGRFAAFRDPDGNRWSLHEPAAPG